MSSESEVSDKPRSLSELTLDPTLYNPTAEEVAFFKSQTGIESDEELKEHILTVQKEAWDVCLVLY